jgi:hypothetical protein
LSTSEWTSHHRQNRIGPLPLSEREDLSLNYLDRPLYLDVRLPRPKAAIGAAETRSLRPFAMLLQPHKIDRSELLPVGARDRAGHGTELQREGTTSREGTEDSLEASPPDTPGAARDGVRQEADQLINNGMDDAMLDSVIIPALDNVRPVLKVETVPITILQC